MIDMSGAINPDFEFPRGDNHDQPFAVQYRSTGLPVDITDAQLIFSVKQKKSDLEFLFQRKNLAAGGDATQIEMTDPSNGKFVVHIIPSNTTGKTGDIGYWYDIQMVLDLKTYTIKIGQVFIKSDITN